LSGSFLGNQSKRLPPSPAGSWSKESSITTTGRELQASSKHFGKNSYSSSGSYKDFDTLVSDRAKEQKTSLISDDYLPNHNYNKIVKSDWLSTALISALIGQFNRTVRVMPK